MITARSQLRCENWGPGHVPVELQVRTASLSNGPALYFLRPLDRAGLFAGHRQGKGLYQDCGLIPDCGLCPLCFALSPCLLTSNLAFIFWLLILSWLGP